MAYSKYKDDSPAATLARIRGILDELGIHMQERMRTFVNGACSMRLEDTAHGWGVNGKGTDEAYCLASGYGEAIERLQSGYAYDASPDSISEKAASYLGFTRWPDEEKRPWTDIETIAPEVWRGMKNAWTRSGHGEPTDEQLYKLWKTWACTSDTTFAPFYSVREKRLRMLPERVISKLCGSNGLSAGNTPEEALCQAAAEVLERFAKNYIFVNQLTPPEIPADYLRANHPDLCRLIDAIEAKSGYKIYVRDASAGLGLPVAAILFIDRAGLRYHVKFGAHPRFNVALERCLTELLQGYEPGVPQDDARFLTAWSRDSLRWDSYRNTFEMYRTDAGALPDSFLAGDKTWAFEPWGEGDDFNNARGVREQLDILLRLAPDVFIRDTGFLGFPTYRVYVPGVADNDFPFSDREFDSRCFVSLLEQIATLSGRLDATAKAQLLSACEDDNMTVGHRDQSVIAKTPLPAIKAALALDTGDTEKAISYLRTLKSPVYHCAARMLELKLKGVNERDMRAMLQLFFEKRQVDFAMLIWNGDNALDALFNPYGLGKPTPHPRAAAVDDSYEAVNDRLHMAVKEKMRANMPEQNGIAALFV